MRLVCPHCQNPIELVETAQGEVLCPSCGSTIRLENTSTTAWSPSDGQRKLGKFELIERIGMGPFGTVYKARVDHGLLDPTLVIVTFGLDRSTKTGLAVLSAPTLPARSVASTLKYMRNGTP